MVISGPAKVDIKEGYKYFLIMINNSLLSNIVGFIFGKTNMIQNYICINILLNKIQRNLSFKYMEIDFGGMNDNFGKIDIFV